MDIIHSIKFVGKLANFTLMIQWKKKIWKLLVIDLDYGMEFM
jgi:hypothetical protein